MAASMLTWCRLVCAGATEPGLALELGVTVGKRLPPELGSVGSVVGGSVSLAGELVLGNGDGDGDGDATTKTAAEARDAVARNAVAVAVSRTCSPSVAAFRTLTLA